MKKSIFIIAALLTATFANAQITYDGFFKGKLTTRQDPHVSGDLWKSGEPRFMPSVPFVIGITSNTDTIYLYNKSDFSILKTITFNETIRSAFGFAKGVYFGDDKIGFIVKLNDGYWICDEDGNKIYSINQITQDNDFYASGAEIVELDNSIKLLLHRHERGTYIFTLPGNGETQAISTPSSPKRSARKIARDGQVLVQTDNNTYTLTGTEVK